LRLPVLAGVVDTPESTSMPCSDRESVASPVTVTRDWRLASVDPGSPSLSLRHHLISSAADDSRCDSSSSGSSSTSLSSSLSSPGSEGFRKINYDELNFLSLTPLGKGAFGAVFAAEWRGARVAVKKLYSYIDPVLLTELKSECALMTRCSNHPNVIKFIGTCIENAQICIVTELQRCSVFDAVVERKEAFTKRDILRILYQSACGVLHLHMEGVIHRDIAARNFLLDAHNNVFVCDFGLARVKTGAYQRTASSLGPVTCMAPESIVKKRYSESSDAWSFGVYVWEVTHAREPFKDVEVFDVAMGVVTGTLRLAIDAAAADTYGSVIVEMMQHCWQADPNARPKFDAMSSRLAALVSLPV